ncbi:mechanosensitive ion channel family protein [Parashewanella curva]|uniref:Mechanosensing system component YbdG n=1 Tax=Parashewanella curva TaxID=2338552 RepID=A0A3L8PUC8_9GAMM|nr:mechanosensitive ion channel domain-containing protein [Parashewanella curva]RLV59011.1 mechanosensitive ion channel family protein [Parashewanella curva]
MEKDFPIDVNAWLLHHGFSQGLAEALTAMTMLIISILLVWLVYLVVKSVILRFIHALIHRTKVQWDDLLVEHKVFDKAVIVLPILVLSEQMTYILSEHQKIASGTQRVLSALAVVFIIRAIYSALDVGETLFERSSVSRRIPSKSFVQLTKLFLFLVGAVLAIAAIIDESPLFFLSGLGVATGLLAIVFKDTILGFVAGVQLAANRMVSVGDWIQMDKYGADGEVIEVSLTTVKVQNWDKTFSMIPAYALVSDAFKNWQGMSESGGRRIKRAVYIDLSSVRFLSEEDKNELLRINHLKEYIPRIESELAQTNAQVLDFEKRVNGRRLTNVGTFRAYLKAYLENHEKIHKGMTLLVRQLDPGAQGLPIEIYVFTNDTNWGTYEDIQSDIFDHIFAILPEFDLKAFQSPSGEDVRQTHLVIKES